MFIFHANKALSNLIDFNLDRERGRKSQNERETERETMFTTRERERANGARLGIDKGTESLL